MLIDTETIMENSSILEKIASYFEYNYPSLQIEKKFLTNLLKVYWEELQSD